MNFFISFKESQIYNLLKELISKTLNTSISLFKIMIPISLLVQILQIAGFIKVLSQLLTPFMKMIDLPGEFALVWTTTMISNIYGGMLVFYNVSENLHITAAQMTILSMLMLGAHTLPVELKVAQEAGVKLVTMFFIRFLFAFFAAFCLNLIYKATGMLDTPINASQILQKSVAINSWADFGANWPQWLLSEAKRYLTIVVYIFCLLSLMKLLNYLGIIEVISKTLQPMLKVLGIGKDVIPITVIGTTLGILYGGALIINETKQKTLDKMDIFYAFTLMGLCHSLIEDSLLMLSLGANYTGVFVFRIIYTLVVTLIIVKTTKKWSEKWQKRILVN
jgi:hypothetical protein